MGEINQQTKLLDEVLGFVKVAKKFSDKRDLLWHLERINESYAQLFEKFCPFQVGQRVKLVETLDILEDSGWYHCRHFLVKDSPAVVRTREWSVKGGCFVFYVAFENESYFHHRTGEEIFSEENMRHVFGMQDYRLTPADKEVSNGSDRSEKHR